MSGSSVLEREMSLAARFHSDEAARYALALIKWSGPAAADHGIVAITAAQRVVECAAVELGNVCFA